MQLKTKIENKSVIIFKKIILTKCKLKFLISLIKSKKTSSEGGSDRGIGRCSTWVLPPPFANYEQLYCKFKIVKEKNIGKSHEIDKISVQIYS